MTREYFSSNRGIFLDFLDALTTQLDLIHILAPVLDNKNTIFSMIYEKIDKKWHTVPSCGSQ
jgi:hypothetical protein